MDSLFFTLILFSVLAYGLHGTLLTIFVRKIDSLNVTIYRNLSFIITMLPLLFFTTFDEISKLADFLPELFFASSAAVVALWTRLECIKHMPFGIATSIRQGIQVVFAFFLGYFILGELFTFLEISIIFIILLAVVSISLMKMQTAHLENSNKVLGFILIIIGGIFNTLAFFYFAILSRELNPFIATYFWESVIGIIALSVALIFGGKQGLPKIKILRPDDIIKISLVSTLTIIGTLGFAFALRMGDFAIASSLMVTVVVVQAILGYFFLKEKLNIRQILAILLIVVAVMALKLIS